MSTLKKLAGQTVIYGLSSILGRSINFLLIILYTSYLSKADLGAYSSIYALIGFLNIVFTYGMETSFFRFSTGKNLNPEQVYSNTQSLLITSSLILGTGLYFLAPTLAGLMDYEGQAFLFRWTAMILTFDAVLAIPYAKLRLENKAFTFAGTKLLNIFLNIFLNVLLIAWMPQWIDSGLVEEGFLGYRSDWGVEYIFLSNLIANGLIIPFVWWKAGFFRFSLDKSVLGPMWKYSIPLLFMGLAGVNNELVSRLLFEYTLPGQFYAGLSSREAGGVFGATFRLAILMNLVIQAFRYAAEPFFFRQSSEKNSPQLYARVMHAFILFCTLLMIAISVNLNWIGPLFIKGDGYAEAFHIVPTLLFGYLFLGIYFNLSIWFKLTDHTRYSFWITLLGAVVTLVVILIFVPKFGYLGGALSTLACYLVMTVVCYFLGQKYFPVPYQTGKGILYLTLAFAISYLGFFLDLGSFSTNFLAKNSLLLVFIGLIAILEKKELSTLYHSLKKS